MRPRSALLSKSRKTGIIWDLDGTIADSAQLAIDTTNSVLIQNGFRDETAKVMLEEYLAGHCYTTPRRLSWHATGHPDDPSGNKLAEDFDAIFTDMAGQSNIYLFPEMVGVIEEIHSDSSIAQAVLSNACGAYVRKLCAVLGVSEYMVCCLGADDVPAAKPDPRGILQCCDSLGVPPQFCVYVGDSRTDGLAARDAGCKSIYCAWDDRTDASEISSYFSCTVHSKEELLRLLTEFSVYGKENNRRKSKSIMWDPDVEDNEHANKLRTDNEYWDGR